MGAVAAVPGAYGDVDGRRSAIAGADQRLHGVRVSLQSMRNADPNPHVRQLAETMWATMFH